MSGLAINITLYERFNKAVPKPINNHPGYDMIYIRPYIVNYRYGTDINKIIEIEKQYDVKPAKKRHTVRILMDGADMDMMKYHWDNECSKAKTENGRCKSYVSEKLYDYKSYSEHKRRQLTDRLSRQELAEKITARVS
ncbi:2013_t:CDS:2 [Diversispora eburnea]|uniref:2013_t:CDS:1 n=1 Tax=Diversispora eburnea TaxID=1213867 RepID=A0A9N9B0I4_9GLOM|nr:2013_t:CDS:2 [Diversispora eburnea]